MTTIGLNLDRPDVSVDDFTEAFSAQIRLLREVMSAMGLPANEVRWVVADLRAGSAYAAARPQVLGEHIYMADIDKAIAEAGRGIRSLMSSSERPAYFNDEALQNSRRLVEIASAFDGGHAQLIFGSTEIPPSPALVQHVESIIKGNVASIGSIEGQLIGVSTRDGSYRISIRDRVTSRQVRCTLPPELLKQALASFESRVSARGVVWSRIDGTAVRIDVRQLDTLPSDEQLPTHNDVRGILDGFRLADGE